MSGTVLLGNLVHGLYQDVGVLSASLALLIYVHSVKKCVIQQLSPIWHPAIS